MDVDEHDEELADVRVTTTVSADRQTPPPPPAAAAAYSLYTKKTQGYRQNLTWRSAGKACTSLNCRVTQLGIFVYRGPKHTVYFSLGLTYDTTAIGGYPVPQHVLNGCVPGQYVCLGMASVAVAL